MYARVQVDIDLQYTPPQKVLIERNGHSFEVGVTYESLPEFCTHCMSIGHFVGNCRSIRRSQEEAAKASSFKDPKIRPAPKEVKYVFKVTPAVTNTQQAVTNESPFEFPVNANDETNINVSINEAMGSVLLSTQQQTFIPKTASKPIELEQTPLPSPHINAASINEGNGILPAPSHSGSTFISSSHSTASKSVESFVPCTYSSHKYSKNKGTSLTTGSSSSKTKSITISSSSPNQSTNRCSFSGTSSSKKYLSNQYAALTNHWEDDGDGQYYAHEDDEDDDDEDHSQSIDDDNHYFAASHTMGRNWEALIDEPPFQSWEERADAAFAAATADHEESSHLHEDESPSALIQDFPPLPTQPNASHSPTISPILVPYSPVALPSQKSRFTQNSHSSSHGGSEFVHSPIQTRAQRQKKTTALSLNKQQKMKKTTLREAKAIARRSTSNSHVHPLDPDAFQWQLYEKDKKKREAETAASEKPPEVAQSNSCSSSQPLYQWQVHLQEKKKRDDNAAMDQSVNAAES
ncbi:hypothetical protein LguiA_020810 [Lonicera macranthoides]